MLGLALTLADDQKREQQIRVPEMLAALEVKTGARVADIGAGDGFLTVRLARLVGPAGRVWAVDIDAITAIPALKRIRKKHRNVQVVAGSPASPSLPASDLDAAIMVISYHEVSEHQRMLAEIKRALKPGGLLVVVDFFPCRTRNSPRAIQAKAHALLPDFAEAEFRAAGFEIASRNDHFIDRPDEEQARWMIVCRKPAAVSNAPHSGSADF